MVFDLQIYNTLSRRIEVFCPQKKNHVCLYVCGPTVYDYCHLGHARVFAVFDVVVRWFRALSYEVFFVRNITDVDDKIIERARLSQCSIDSLTQTFIDALHEDCEALGFVSPSEEPRATDFIPVMIQMIQALFDQEAAYQTTSGDVCFSIKKFHQYGFLSGHSLDHLEAGHRIDCDTTKNHPLDFVLWKKAKPGEVSWPSPWGEGRPGWHIECSAMSHHYFGKTFDIHGGGADLIFPHHENERAQSCLACGGECAKYWMHNGFIQINQQKMSKSLANFCTIRALLKQHHPEVIRFFLIRSHYRSAVDYSDASLKEANEALSRLYRTLYFFPPLSTEEELIDWDNIYAKRFREAMNYDFATPEAFSILFELSNEINRSEDRQLSRILLQLGQILGFFQTHPASFLGYHEKESQDDQFIEELIQKRKEARQNKDWILADHIRDNLLKHGVGLEDQGTETLWRRLK